MRWVLPSVSPNTRNDVKKTAVPWWLPQVGDFGQKQRVLVRFTIVPVLVRLTGLGWWQFCNLLGTASAPFPLPQSLNGLKTLPPPTISSSPDKTTSFLSSLATLFALPSPGPASSHAHPPWEAGSGASAAPEGHPCPSPSAAHHPPCQPGTRGHGQCARVCSSTTTDPHPRQCSPFCRRLSRSAGNWRC